MLSRNRLRQDFGIEQIPHYATHPNNLYGALLQGRLIRPAHMPLTNDVEEGAREAPARRRPLVERIEAVVDNTENDETDSVAVERELEQILNEVSDDCDFDDVDFSPDPPDNDPLPSVPAPATPIVSPYIWPAAPATPLAPVPLAVPTTPIAPPPESPAAPATPLAPVPPPLPPPRARAARGPRAEGLIEMWGCFRISLLPPNDSRPFGACEA